MIIINKTIDKKIATLNLLLALSTNSYSQDGDEALFSEDIYFEDVPLIHDANRLRQKITDTSASVSIIDRKMIEDSGAINIVDLFRFIPGFVVSHTNGGSAAVASHGITDRSPKRLEVRVNGSPIYNQFTNATQWLSIGIEVEDIEQIEVVRGSNSSSFGFNSFLASVNIITKSPLKDSGTQATLTTGSIGRKSLNVRHTNDIGPVRFKVGAGYKKDDGFPLLHDPSEAGHFLLHGFFAPTIKDEIEFQAYVMDAHFFQADVADGIAFFKNDFINTRESIRWSHLFDSGNEFKIHFHHDYYTSQSGPVFLTGNRTLSDIGIPAGLLGLPDERLILENESLSHRYDMESSYTSTSGSFKWVAGGGVRHVLIDSPDLLFLDEEVSRTSGRLFSNVEYPITKRLLFNGSIMFQASNDNTPSVSPKIGLNYKITDNHIIRGNLAYSERFPALLFKNNFIPVKLSNDVPVAVVQFSDTDIDNERLISYELGYLGLFHNKQFTVDLRLFREEIRDGIDDFPNTSPTSQTPFSFFPQAQFFDNTSNWDLTGLESEFKYKFNNNTYIHLNYAYTHADGDRKRSISPFRFEDISDAVPQHSLGLLASKHFDNNWHLSSQYYFLSKMRWLGIRTPIDSYDRWDMKLGKTFSIGSSEIDASIIIHNLLDDDYSEFQPENIFERRAFLQLKLDL